MPQLEYMESLTSSSRSHKEDILLLIELAGQPHLSLLFGKPRLAGIVNLARHAFEVNWPSKE